MRRASDSGVSLIEMLVVLAIVGVMAGAVLTLPQLARSPSPLDSAHDQLAQDLRDAASTGALTASSFVMSWTETGYTIKQAGQETRRDLPAGVTLGAQGQPPFAVSHLSVPAGLEPLKLTLTSARNRADLLFDGLSLQGVKGQRHARY